jgi:integrase
LSPEEVARLIDAAGNLQARTILMTLYSTGMRRSELVRLRVEDIDSQRMVIHIHQGKGGKDRDVPLCPRLLQTLREYWRWKKPKTWLFPGEQQPGKERPALIANRTLDVPRPVPAKSLACPIGRTGIANPVVLLMGINGD